MPNTRILPCRHVNVDYLARILRLLSPEGVVTEHKSNAGSTVYSLTDAGKLLQVTRSRRGSLSYRKVLLRLTKYNALSRGAFFQPIDPASISGL